MRLEARLTDVANIRHEESSQKQRRLASDFRGTALGGIVHGGTTQCGQPNVVQPNVVQPNVVQPNVVQPKVVQPVVAQPVVVQSAWHGPWWYSPGWHSKDRTTLWWHNPKVGRTRPVLRFQVAPRPRHTFVLARVAFSLEMRPILLESKRVLFA